MSLKKVKVNFLGNEFEVNCASGVFSSKKIDKGTELFIKNIQIKDGWDVLDLGCGVGVVGIAVKLAYDNINVVFSDVNKRAIKVTNMNLDLNAIEDVEVIYSDLYAKIDKKFDTILCNPPQCAGKDVCFSVIDNAKDHLKKNGLLQIVARHNKGGKTLSERMKTVFGNVEEIAKGSGYRVYVSQMN